MAKLDDHTISDVAHILAIGSNGSGKTGMLASLAKAGYNLRIVDYDGGTEILKQVLRDKPEARARIDVETFVDKYGTQIGTGAFKAQNPVAFEKSMGLLSKWGEFGNPMTWGKREVLVIDSLTMMGRACMNHVFKMKGKLTSMDAKDLHPSQPDWGDAMGLQENFLAMLSSLPCHVIVMAHVTFVTPEGQTNTEGFASALGSKLPPKVGSYFNHTLYVGQAGVAAKRRVIFTKSTGLVTTKTSAPGKVKDEYPIETGLAEYFEALFGKLEAEPAKA